MEKKQQLKIRDKKITSRRLINAVGSLLAKKGFVGVGVNAVAREAGVDKVLIYRYFGGLEGLITAFAKEGDFWPSALELAGGDLQKFSQMPLDERLSCFGSNFFQALKKRPVTQAIMAWEMIEPNGLTEELERIREEGIMEFFKMFFTREEINFDLQAVIMLFGAGISYLVIRSNHIDVFGGLELNSDEGWKRMEKAFENITHGILNNR
ncbi:MAG: TetR/AcrR family transcriptional regulator [Deltaproteobacteria bacterium]|jgi:AcrR family transcriptional regulator|nr:TetR/AcrR family transcriptional regulator [Deltaproteobacteria bacterium]